MAADERAHEVAELLFGCFKRLRHLVDGELSGCGLSVSRTKLLSELSSNGPQQQGVLAAKFGLAPRTVTELVDTLEKAGLVERHLDPSDRRARLVSITPAGDEARKVGDAVREQIMNRVFGALDDEQMNMLTSALRQVQAQLNELQAEDTPSSGSAAGLPITTP